ncbi:VOC family protein [Streptomyces sp. NPDC086783]|uniref:VOC family protein n=1 Tax=Streptomyces sp. NPDC086783 TaxID=3365758 RepID=UPI0038143F0D
MDRNPEFTLAATVLDAPDARELSVFYRGLLGWEVREDGPDWVMIAPPEGGAGLSFQTEPHFVPPHWPAVPDEQQMMLHLDLEVDDLSAALTRATALGARPADVQPQDDVRVLFDPVGHPFCLFVRDSGPR